MAELNMGLFPQYENPIDAQAKGFNYAQKVQDLATSRQAGQQYSTGDYAGASQTLAKSGDIANAEKLREQGQKTTGEGQKYIAQALPVLKRVAAAHAKDPDGGTAARSQTFDQIAGEAQQITGASPKNMQILKDMWVRDPESFLARLDAQIPTEYKTAGDSLFTFKNGQLANTYTGLKTITAPSTDNIYQIGGNGGPTAPAAAPQQPATAAPATPAAPQNVPSEADVQGYIAKNIPGAIITSGQRTPDHNAAVGGVPDSLHIPGQAVDFVMPKGMTFDQVKAMVAQTGFQPTELLNEGSHVHIAWGPKPGGPQTAAYAPPAPQAQATPPGVTLLQRGQAAFRDPTAAEKAQFPGVSQMGANGQAHYPPAAAMPSQLTPEALDQMAAVALRNGGRLPPGYARDRATVAAVTNRLAQLKPPSMSDDDFAKVMQNNILQFEARKAAGGQAAKGQIGTAINEGTVNNSISILRKLIPVAASKGNFTQINNLQQFIRRSSNDANAVNFKNAIDSISNEYARVMTGATGGSPSSDSARDEAANRILKGYNANTLPHVLDLMQAEMRGRSDSYKSVLSQLTGGYGGVDVPNDPAQDAPGPQAKATTVSNW